jgi:glucosamine--fructose-6-phosphate aminotransferase (isomerizing)
MCGIVAYLGNDDAFNILHNSLKILQNRGYDSAGIATINKNNEIILDKFTTDDISAVEKLEKCDLHIDNKIGIAHTRWATHGDKSQINAHPHCSMNNKIAIVHNGIINNHVNIQNLLKKNNFIQTSETDSECISNLIEKYLNDGFDTYSAIEQTCKHLDGTWALAIINKDEPNNLYITRNGSPLLVGFNDDHKFCIISSEQSVFSNITMKYSELENNKIIKLVKNNNTINILQLENIKYTIHQEIETTPYPFKHWTIKEIHSQQNTHVVDKRIVENNIILSEIEQYKTDLVKIKHLIIIGSGSSLNAGYIGAHFMRDIKQFSTIQVFDSSEFELKYIFNMIKEDICVICVSQSGETKDTSIIVDMCNEENIKIISIVNVKNSYIASNTKCIYTNSGREVGVAATKSFTSQCIVFILLSIWFDQIKTSTIHAHGAQLNKVLDIQNIEYQIKNIIETNDSIYKELSNKLIKENSIFILGNKYTKYIAIEGALKIKEITYIHTEGFLASSLKHGTFSLINKNTPIIYLDIGDDSIDATASQTKCRHALNILITDKQHINKNLYDYIIQIPHNNLCYNILAIIPLQILAYTMSIEKNINPDFPKNLAKTVTVI